MRPLVYTVNTTPIVFSENTPLPLGNIARRYGRSINSDGTTITAAGAGYYEIDVDATVTATATGPVTLSVVQNGTVIATSSITVASGLLANLSVGAIIRNFCYAPSSNIQIFVDGTSEPTVQRLGVRVKEV